MREATTTTTTTVVTELPAVRYWMGRDWVKALIAGGLALSLLRPGAQPVASTLPAPTAVVPAATLPAVQPAPTLAPTVVAAPAVDIPLILATRETVFAGPYIVRGTGTPGSTVELLLNDTSLGTTTVGEDGRWSLETALEAGENVLQARAVDEAGATLAEGDATTLLVETVAAEPPTILSSRETVFAGSYVIRGTGTPGSTVDVLVNGASVGTASVADDGTWSLETVLEAGENELVARTVVDAGASLAESEPVALAVEAAPVAAPGGGPTFDAPTGEVLGGLAVLTGTGTPGSTVRVTIGGVDAGTTVVAEDGTWQLEAILVEGTPGVLVEELDPSGSVVAASQPTPITVVGGSGVAISAPAEGATLPSGPLTVSGTGTPGAVLEILNGDAVLGQTTVGTDGSWSAEVPVDDGSVSISVREQGSDQILARPVRVQVGSVESSACTSVAVNCEAWVTRAGGLQLRMRSSGAILADNIIARLPIGTQMTVLEGPSPADGFTWWRVRTVGGQEGWVAGENLVPQPD
jgi:hypothetical protein